MSKDREYDIRKQEIYDTAETYEEVQERLAALIKELKV